MRLATERYGISAPHVLDALSVFDRSAGGLLAAHVGVRRRARDDGRAGSGRSGSHARRAVLSGCDAQLRRQPADAAGRWAGSHLKGEDRGTRSMSWAELLRRRHACRGGAAAGRRQAWRPGRRLSSQHSRDDRRSARRRGGRRGVVVLLAGLRRPGRGRSLRADRAEDPPGRRRRTRTAGKRHDCTARVAEVARALPSVRRTVVVSYLGTPGTQKIAGTSSTWHEFTSLPAAERHAVRAAAVQSSALHPLFLGHDRRAEVHRPWRRRHADPAPQGAPAPQRHRARGTASSTSRRAAG